MAAFKTHALLASLAKKKKDIFIFWNAYHDNSASKYLSFRKLQFYIYTSMKHKCSSAQELPQTKVHNFFFSKMDCIN